MEKVIQASRLVIGRTVLAAPTRPESRHASAAAVVLPRTQGGLRPTVDAPDAPSVDVAALRRSIENELRQEWQAEHRASLVREREAARKEGLAQGMAEAHAARQKNDDQAEAELQARNSAMLASLQQAHADAIVACEKEVGPLAFEAICRIAGQVAVESKFVRGIVSTVCKEARVNATATVRLHPRDLRLLAGESKTLSLPDGPTLTLQADDTIAHGGCQVETDFGQFDGTLATQLQRLHQVLCAGRGEGQG